MLDPDVKIPALKPDEPEHGKDTVVVAEKKAPLNPRKATKGRKHQNKEPKWLNQVNWKIKKDIEKPKSVKICLWAARKRCTKHNFEGRLAPADKSEGPGCKNEGPPDENEVGEGCDLISPASTLHTTDANETIVIPQAAKVKKSIFIRRAKMKKKSSKKGQDGKR